MPVEPLIVLNAFVIRADSQPPEAIRRARPRYNVNRAGEGIEDPGVTDRQLALTARPQLEWEAFDEYWRKVHGPKILHVDGPTDRQTGVLAYYLQQHRLPGGPRTGLAPPYAPVTDVEGMLVRDPAARIRPYERPAWDGLAQLAFRSKADLETFFDVRTGKYGDKIVPDEAVFIRGFGFHLAEEHIVVDAGDRRRDAIVVLTTHVRNPELSRAQFRGAWMGQHGARIAQLARTNPVLRRYAQLVNVSAPEDALYDPIGDRFDGVSAMSFANMNDAEDFLGSEDYRALQLAEQDFARESSFFTTLNYVIRDVTT